MGAWGWVFPLLGNALGCLAVMLMLVARHAGPDDPEPPV